MNRDFIEIFRAKLNSRGIKGKDLGASAGRTPQNISEVLNRKVSPSIESFRELVEAADRLRPGFADEFYLELCGRVDMVSMVRGMSAADLGTLLVVVSTRLAELLPSQQQQRVAA
jgi:hypothetical protein